MSHNAPLTSPPSSSSTQQASSSQHQTPSQHHHHHKQSAQSNPPPLDDIISRLQLKTPIQSREFSHGNDDSSSEGSNGGNNASHTMLQDQSSRFIADESLGDILQNEPSSLDLMAKSSLFIEKQQQQYIQQLKSEIQAREAEMEASRTQARRREAELEDKILEIEHRHDLQVMKLKSQSKLNEKKYTDIFKRTGETIEALKNKIVQLEDKRPAYDRQLDDVKRTLSGDDLLVTENVYIDIKKAPLGQVSLKEFVQQKVYEFVAPLKSEVMSLKKERDLLDENFKHTSANYEKLQREHQHVLRLGEETKSDLIRQVAELDKSKSRLSAELQDQIRFYEEFKAKEQVFDETKAQSVQYREEAYRYQKQVEEIEGQLRHAQRELEESQKRLSTVSQQFELSQQDKNYLSKQNEDHNERILRLQKDIDYKQDKYKDLKKQKNVLYEKLLDIKQTSKTEYEHQLQQEIDKLRNQTEKDLDRIRASAKDAFDRENRILRETKEHAERQAEQARAELFELKESYEQLLLEHRSLSTKSERQMTELQSQIKLKTFEAERAAAQLLETSTNLNKARSEIDVLHKKLELVRDEYYNLQSESNKTIVRLESDLRATRERLDQYEHMEKALNEGLDELGTVNDLTPEEENLQIQNLKQIPSSHSKRLQYCLLVIKKLSHAEKRIEALQHSVQQKNSEVLTFQKKAEQLQSKLDNSSKPSHYLVDSIDERDRAIEKLRKEAEKNESRTKKMKAEIARLKKRKQTLEKDVEKLLERVQFTNKLRSMLANRLGDENVPPMMSGGRSEQRIPAEKEMDEQDYGVVHFTK